MTTRSLCRELGPSYSAARTGNVSGRPCIRSRTVRCDMSKAAFAVRRRPWPWLLAASALVAAALPALAGAPAQAAVPAPPAGFRTVWSEDFSGPAGAGLDGANWLYDVGTGYP